MAYDYHEYRWYYSLTGANAPLFSPRNATEDFLYSNINSSIQYWISMGVPKEKILLGIPTYGHSFE